MEAHPRDRRSPQAPRNPGTPHRYRRRLSRRLCRPREPELPRRPSNPPPLAATEQHYLNEGELARRWGLSPKTLQRWRGEGVGPVFVKFSRRVAYPLQGPGGILDLEQRSRYRSTSERVTAPGGRE
jgi:hypothetical protein